MNQNNNNMPSKSEFQRLQDFLAWAKENDIAVTEVSAGSVSVSMVDLSLIDQDVATPSRDEGQEPSNLYEDILRRRGIRPNA